MAKKKFSELPLASALDGSEIVAVVQDGSSKQTTAQDIADLATPSVVSSLGRINVDTSGADLPLDFNNLYGVVARAFDDVITDARTISYSNDTNVQDWYLYIQLTDTATLEFPAGTVLDDVRFDGTLFTPDEGSEQMVYVFHFIGDTETGFFGHLIYVHV